MKCQCCGESFAQMRDGYDDIPYGARYERVSTHTVCPFCGAQETEEEYLCAQCGEEVCESDMSDGFCRFCAQDLEQTLEWMCSMLTPAQREWMRMHPEWVEMG